MMLADHGAEVIRVMPPGGERSGLLDSSKDVLARSRKVMLVDLKQPNGVNAVRDLCKSADGVIEGFRPGVMERLGLGPAVLLADNPKLVYGRMTGWGQTGPRAHTAGHDINYIALSGVPRLYRPRRPSADSASQPHWRFWRRRHAARIRNAGCDTARPKNRRRPGGRLRHGGRIRAAGIDDLDANGAGRVVGARGSNMLDTGAHFYDTYACADGGYVSVGPIAAEILFGFLRRLGIAETAEYARQHDRNLWPVLKQRLAGVFAGKSRQEWCAIFDGSDACVAPVLSMAEAPGDRTMRRAAPSSPSTG